MTAFDPKNMPEWRQTLPGEEVYLDSLIGTFDDSFQNKLIWLNTLGALGDERSKADLLLLYVPQILGHLEDAAATVPDIYRYKIILEFVKTTLCKYRPTKIRFLTMILLGKHKEFWNVKLEVRSDAYNLNESDYSTMKKKVAETVAEAVTDLKESGVNANVSELSFRHVSAPELLESEDTLRKWVNNVFLHPAIGIERKEHRVALRTEKECFSEEDCVLYILEKLLVQMQDASQIGARLVRAGLITKVTFFPDATEFGRGKNYYRPTTSPDLKQAQADDYAFGITVPNNSIDQVKFTTTVYVDRLDMQSFSFWREAIFSKTLTESEDFGWVQVIHPLKGITDAQVEDCDVNSATAAFLESVAHGGITGDRVYVNKVFSSQARPGIVSVQVAPEASVVGIQEKMGFSGDQFKSLAPKLIVKEGDDLMQDMNVELMFRLFNHLWSADRDTFPDPDKVPFSYAYDVFPTGPKAGCIEVLTNLAPLNHYNWAKQWVNEAGKHPEGRDIMLRSAAGSYVAAYVLGARDRHWDNICIKDNCILLHIDFGFVLGTTPPIDGPRFSISPDMEQAFVDVGIWEPFVDLCGKAFMSLRKQPLIVRETCLLFRHTGVSYTDSTKYLSNKDSLNSNQTAEEAEEFIRKQVRNASRDWKTFMRSFAHDQVDPIYYMMLKRKFPSALLVDKIVKYTSERKTNDGEFKHPIHMVWDPIKGVAAHAHSFAANSGKK